MPTIPFQLNPEEVQFQAVRSQGAGGQNVNKVSSAVHLRFDIAQSTLPLELKDRLLQKADQRITADGVVIIKSQDHRNQEQNRSDAMQRLLELLLQVAYTPKKRKATKATKGSQERRLASKSKRSEVKRLRKNDE